MGFLLFFSMALIVMSAMTFMQHFRLLYTATLAAGSEGEKGNEKQGKTGFHNVRGDGFTETGRLQAGVTQQTNNKRGAKG